MTRKFAARRLERLLARTRCAALWADRSGVTIIEFALVAAPLAAFMVAILQISLVFFAQQNLETTAEKAAREMLTGQVQQAGMSTTQFRTLVCSKLTFFMSCSNVMIDVRNVANFSDISTALPTITYDTNGNINNAWVYSPGGAGTVNIVRIMYVWNVSPGPLGFNIATIRGNQRLLVATSIFKTEPYNS